MMPALLTSTSSRPKRCERALDQAPHLAGIADVGLDEQRLPAVRLDRLDRRGARLGIDVGDHHRRPLGGERVGAGAADALGAAGDDRDLTVESHPTAPLPAKLAGDVAWRAAGGPSRLPRAHRNERVGRRLSDAAAAPSSAGPSPSQRAALAAAVAA